MFQISLKLDIYVVSLLVHILKLIIDTLIFKTATWLLRFVFLFITLSFQNSTFSLATHSKKKYVYMLDLAKVLERPSHSNANLLSLDKFLFSLQRSCKSKTLCDHVDFFSPSNHF